MSPEDFLQIRNREGERLDFRLVDGVKHDAKRAGYRRPLVLMGHGVTSHHDRPWFRELALGLARADLASLRFSYAGNGESEGRFEEATPTKELEDLASVLDACEEAGFGPITYVGHSMGAAIGVMRAVHDTRISALVSLAGMFHVARFFERHFGRLVPGRDLLLGKPECPWNEALKQDTARIGSLTKDAAAIRVPWLLVHGDKDEMVPLEDALDARTAAGGRPDLVTLPGVDHRFGGAIPALVAATVPWLARQLR